MVETKNLLITVAPIAPDIVLQDSDDPGRPADLIDPTTYDKSEFFVNSIWFRVEGDE